MAVVAAAVVALGMVGGRKVKGRKQKVEGGVVLGELAIWYVLRGEK